MTVTPQPVIYSEEEDGPMVTLVLPRGVVLQLRHVLFMNVTPAMGLDMGLYDELGHQLRQQSDVQ